MTYQLEPINSEATATKRHLISDDDIVDAFTSREVEGSYRAFLVRVGREIERKTIEAMMEPGNET